MADVLFLKYLKTLKILNRLHKQNQEILRVQTPIFRDGPSLGLWPVGAMCVHKGNF